MQQINVIVTPKAKQTISVTVNGVAMSVVNSDGSYSTTHYSGTPFIIPNITVTDSDGSTYSHPSVKDVICTPPVGADVENSDGSYTQHVNNGATLILPDTIVKNTAGTTILTQPSATSTGVIADSVVTNSDDSFVVNVPAEEPLELADITVYSKDANGQIIATPYPAAKDYTEAGSIPDANGWIRPADWLPISHLVTDGEEKAVGLYAVWDAAGIANGYNNYCALYVTGNYTVDWGDGTVENFASGVQAEHEYIYANMPASSYCSRGYRQAIITITPQAGQHLTLLNYSRKHTLNTSVYCTNGILDVYLSGTDLSRVTFYESTYSQCKLLEKFYGYQVTNKLTNMYYMFYNCYSLQTLDLSSFNTAAVTNMSYMFYNCYSLQTLDLSSFNTAVVTNMYQIFYNCNSLQTLDLSSFNTAAVKTMSYMFGYCYSLQTLDLSSFNTAAVTTMSLMFYNCHSLQTLDLSSFNTAAVTTMSQMLGNCYSLQTLDLSSFNTAVVTNMYQMFYNCNSLKGINLAHTTLAAVTNNAQITNNTGQLLICRLPFISKTFTVANNKLTATELNALFGDLKDLTALAAQTITVTGNPGAATCNPAIATAKNWIVVT